MGWTRHTGTVVSLAALASVVANYAVHQHFERRNHRPAIALERPATIPGAMIFDADMRPDPDDFPSQVPRFLDDTAIADGTVTPAVQASDTSTDGESRGPRPVPAPADPCPLADNGEPTDAQPIESQSSAAVRKVIEEELAGSSQEERDIWFEELKSIPAGVVRDLLQVRKQLRALPRALHKMDPITTAAPVSAPRVTELTAEPASQVRRQPLPDWIQTIAAMEQACAISRHNLANSATPGFKRLRVTVIDSYGSQWRGDAPNADGSGVEVSPSRLTPLQVEGCRISEPVLDLKDGTLQNTGRELDLAIDGNGFFPVMAGERLAYTRCGAMVLNAQRHVCLSVNEELEELQPVIEIPADAREIQVAADGTVRVLVKSGEEPVLVGQLQLARFAGPSLLRPIGATLLVPTEGSGEAELGAPNEGGRGGINQAFLEQSNVDSELETAAIERWQGLMKTFPTGSRPVTASGQEQRSR